jgi:cytochrome c-type biogenesis protein CcmH/NrfG
LVADAESMFSKATTEKPDLAEAQYQLSTAQNALSENDAAIESGKKAVSLNPNNADYIISLGRMLENRGTDNDMKDAEQLFKAVTAQSDQNINGHFYLGLLYEKEKNKQGAKTEYQKVISLLPSGNDDTKNQLQKMVSNLDASIDNTPQSLGLTQQSGGSGNSSTTPAQ